MKTILYTTCIIGVLANFITAAAESALEIKGLDKDVNLRYDSDFKNVHITTGCEHSVKGMNIKFVDKDDTSNVYQTFIRNATENAVATTNSNCSDSKKVYEVDLSITRDLVETDKPFKVKAAPIFANDSSKYPPVISDFTVTVCHMELSFLAFILVAVFIVYVVLILIFIKCKHRMCKDDPPQKNDAKEYFCFLAKVGIPVSLIVCLIPTIVLYFSACLKEEAKIGGPLIGIFTLVIDIILLILRSSKCLKSVYHCKEDYVWNTLRKDMDNK